MVSTSREQAILDLIVHELRTPLSVAAGSLPQISAGISLSEAQQAAAERVRRALDNLNALADQLRAWRRAAESAVAAPVNVAAALARALDSPDAMTRDITFVPADVPGDILTMSARDSFIPALTSIVAAVVRSTPNHSTIRVDVTADATEVRMTVGDVANAPESDFPAEFVGGLGLSMPLARAAIESAGGRIWSKSVDGRIVGIAVALRTA